MTDVFICLTPLHVLIAERIIEDEKIDDFVLIYFYLSDTGKNQFYFNKLSNKARASCYLRKTNSIGDFLHILRELIGMKRQFSQFGKCFSGNVKTGYSRFVLRLLNPKAIYSMDDGIGNIDRGSDYFQSKENFLARLFFSVAGPKYLYKNILDRIVENYTIYTYPNVFKRSKYIPLFKHLELSQSSSKKSFIVFLSGALSADGNNCVLPRKEEMKFYDEIFKRYKIDLIIKHPRQDVWDLLQSPPVSDSVEIAEHQIMNLSRDYRLIIIGTFYSTVLVNIPSEIKRLNVITDSPSVSPGFNLFFKEIGIETVFLKI